MIVSEIPEEAARSGLPSLTPSSWTQDPSSDSPSCWLLPGHQLQSLANASALKVSHYSLSAWHLNLICHFTAQYLYLNRWNMADPSHCFSLYQPTNINSQDSTYFQIFLLSVLLSLINGCIKYTTILLLPILLFAFPICPTHLTSVWSFSAK